MPSVTNDYLGPWTGVLRLPSGYVDAEGRAHHEVELAAITGREEEYLASLDRRLPAATVITELLTRCVRRIGSLQPVNAALVRDMSVGDREYLVVRLWQASYRNKLHVILACPAEGCGKDMEVDLRLDDVPMRFESSPRRTFLLDPTSGALEFRLPTGEDQESLCGEADEMASADELLRRCMVRIPPELDLETVRGQIEQRMEELMARPVLELEGTCPECGAPFSMNVDLAEMALSDAMEQSQRLPLDVHRLAWHYHWPEGEILSMPRPRRARYLHLLEEQLEFTNA